MKNKTKELIKIIFVSYEAVITALLFLLFLLFNSIFTRLGNLILKTPTIFDLLNLFIGGSLLFAIGYSWKILKPKENNKILYEWENYWKIKMVVFVSILIIFTSNLLYYPTYIFRENLKPANVALVILIVILNPIITIANLLLAAFEINEIIDETT